MHELSIALSLVDVATEESDRRGGAAVLAVHLRLGPLAGVVREALLSAFQLAREDTRLAETELVIKDVPLLAFCPICQQERTIASVQELCCPVCDTPCGDVLQGRELEIFALEIVEAETDDLTVASNQDCQKLQSDNFLEA